MSGSTLRKLVLALGVVVIAGTSAYVVSRSADAAQPGSQPPVCWHVGVSDWVCPDSMAARSADNVRSVSLTVELANGRKTTMKLPAGVDAVFLTKASAERFLLSYYWASNRDKAILLSTKLSAMK